jgi:arsenate reductase
MISIYHNPRCSKSRETLALVQTQADRLGQPLQVIEYLQQTPGIAQLQALQQQLGQPLRAMVRDNEEEYAALNLQNADDAALLAALAAHPRLLQRPIVTFNGKAAIGRPPENVLPLFD